MKTFFAFLSMLPLIAACAGPSKAQLDDEVRRLCAIDGGIKVYETVQLPAEKFVRYTQKITTFPYQKLNNDDEYYLAWNVSKLKEGNPSMRRDHFQIIRRSDSKILGDSISYARKGGDIPGPWHESSFRCPDKATDSFLVQRVFIQIDER